MIYNGRPGSTVGLPPGSPVMSLKSGLLWAKIGLGSMRAHLPQWPWTLIYSGCLVLESASVGLYSVSAGPELKEA